MRFLFLPQVSGLDRSWQRPPGVAAKLIDSKSTNGNPFPNLLVLWTWHIQIGISISSFNNCCLFLGFLCFEKTCYISWSRPIYFQMIDRALLHWIHTANQNQSKILNSLCSLKYTCLHVMQPLSNKTTQSLPGFKSNSQQNNSFFKRWRLEPLNVNIQYIHWS